MKPRKLKKKLLKVLQKEDLNDVRTNISKDLKYYKAKYYKKE